MNSKTINDIIKSKNSKKKYHDITFNFDTNYESLIFNYIIILYSHFIVLV